MSEMLSFPYLTAALALPAVMALGLAVFPERRAEKLRWRSVVIAVASAVMLGLAAREAGLAGKDLVDPWLASVLTLGALNAGPLMVLAVLLVVTLLAAPRRDLEGRSLAGLLAIFTGTALATAAASLGWMVAGWWVSCLPGVLGVLGGRKDKLAVWVQVASCIAFTGTVFLTGFGDADFSHSSGLAFGLMLLAVVLRKGIVPAHSWVLDAYQNGPLLPNALLFNGHLGAVLILRAETTPLAGAAQQMLEGVSLWALITALFTTMAAIGQSRPRRILALVSISQAAFILAGLGSRNTEGITGALVHWMVVSVATTGLACVLRAVEARDSETEDARGHLGLAAKTPRLAVVFLVCGLALVGLPGTLGYCAEDLLFHGALASHPLLGISLLVATALNAIHLLRLYSQLFLGRRVEEVPAVPDALPRERWGLGLCVVFLVLGGLVPGPIVSWRGATGSRLAETFQVKAGAEEHSKTPAAAHVLTPQAEAESVGVQVSLNPPR